MAETVEDLLRRVTYRKMDIDPFLDPARRTWSRFDPELGYVLIDSIQKDGVGCSLTEYTYEPGGHRKLVNYADRPCRINTYGDSYTLGHQVSDGETWQEMLAAHLREPVRNFGIGGWSTYTSYLQARRVEPGPCGSEYVILGIFDDDHVRNIDATRWIRGRANWKFQDDKVEPINGTPWAHLRFDLKTGRWTKRPGLCRTEEDLRALCDPAAFYNAYKDDEVVKLFVLERGGDVGDVSHFEQLAEAFGISVNLRDPAKRAQDALELHYEYGFRSTRYILEEMQAWLAGLGKKLMVKLTYGGRIVAETLEGVPRFDQRFLDYMAASGIPCFDAMNVFVDEYKKYNLSPRDYVKLHYVPPSEAAVWSHYTPITNHKMAFWIKDAVVAWLDPKPPAYRQ